MRLYKKIFSENTEQAIADKNITSNHQILKVNDGPGNTTYLHLASEDYMVKVPLVSWGCTRLEARARHTQSLAMENLGILCQGLGYLRTQQGCYQLGTQDETMYTNVVLIYQIIIIL